MKRKNLLKLANYLMTEPVFQGDLERLIQAAGIVNLTGASNSYSSCMRVFNIYEGSEQHLWLFSSHWDRTDAKSLAARIIYLVIKGRVPKNFVSGRYPEGWAVPARRTHRFCLSYRF